jgi:hypothetical protein
VTGDGNALTQALAEDPHLGAIVRSALPAKENGFDIEGLAAAAGGRVLLGLRGPVLRGWAVLLEVAPNQEQPGVLDLPPLAADGRCYRKHLVDLDGLGVRDLALIDGDLYILAGPTMDHDGPQRIYRFRDWGDLPDVSLTAGDTGRLACVFDLPYRAGADRAEGITRFSGCGERALLVVYDGPAAERRVGDTAVYADVFRLP